MYPYQTNRGQLTHDWFIMPQKAKRKNEDNGNSGPATYKHFRIISTDAFGEECSFRRQVGDANVLKGVTILTMTILLQNTSSVFCVVFK